MRKFKISGYSESMDLRDKGAPYNILGFGTVYLRRGGLAQWQDALDKARDEVLGVNYNTNYIDYEIQEQINAKAVSSYLVAKLGDDCIDANGEQIPNNKINVSAIFEDPCNYSLVCEVMEVSFSQEIYLQKQLEKEIEQVKKS